MVLEKYIERAAFNVLSMYFLSSKEIKRKGKKKKKRRRKGKLLITEFF